MEKKYHRFEIRIPQEHWESLRAYGFKFNQSLNKIILKLISKAIKGMNEVL